MCALCCGGEGRSWSVKRGSSAVYPGGVRSWGRMFILTAALDLLLLITSCSLCMSWTAQNRSNADVRKERARVPAGPMMLLYQQDRNRATSYRSRIFSWHFGGGESWCWTSRKNRAEGYSKANKLRSHEALCTSAVLCGLSGGGSLWLLKCFQQSYWYLKKRLSSTVSLSNFFSSSRKWHNSTQDEAQIFSLKKLTVTVYIFFNFTSVETTTLP